MGISETYVTFGWNTVPGATGYNVQYSTFAGPATGTATTNSFTTPNAAEIPMATVCFQVQAVNGGQKSPWSAQYCFTNAYS